MGNGIVRIKILTFIRFPASYKYNRRFPVTPFWPSGMLDKIPKISLDVALLSYSLRPFRQYDILENIPNIVWTIAYSM